MLLLSHAPPIIRLSMAICSSDATLRRLLRLDDLAVDEREARRELDRRPVVEQAGLLVARLGRLEHGGAARAPLVARVVDKGLVVGLLGRRRLLRLQLLHPRRQRAHVALLGRRRRHDRLVSNWLRGIASSTSAAGSSRSAPGVS